MKSTLYTAAVCVALAAPAVSLWRTAQDAAEEPVDATDEALAAIFADATDVAPEPAQDPIGDAIDRMREAEAERADRRDVADVADVAEAAEAALRYAEKIKKKDKDKARADLEEKIERFQVEQSGGRQGLENAATLKRAAIAGETDALQAAQELARRAQDVARVRQDQERAKALSGLRADEARLLTLERELATRQARLAEETVRHAEALEGLAAAEAERQAEVATRGYKPAHARYKKLLAELNTQRDRRAAMEQELARAAEHLARTKVERETLARAYEQVRDTQVETAPGYDSRDDHDGDDDQLKAEIHRRLQRIEERIERLERSRNTQSGRSGLSAPELAAPRRVTPQAGEYFKRAKAPKAPKAPKAAKAPKAPKAAKAPKAPKAAKAPKAPKAMTARKALEAPAAKRVDAVDVPDHDFRAIDASQPEDDFLLSSGRYITDSAGSFYFVAGDVAGRIVDAEGRPVPLAEVKAYRDENGVSYTPADSPWTIYAVPPVDEENAFVEEDEQALLREILDLVEELRGDMNGLRKDVRKLRGEFTGSGAR